MNQTICQKPTTISQLVNYGAENLASAGVSNPRLESELLLCHLLEVNRFDLYFKTPKLNDSLFDKFEELLNSRLKKYPLQYITGWADFMGLKFMVNPDVLIPRPETEILTAKAIELSLNLLDTNKIQQDELCILEIGTGSGNVAISLTKYVSKCRIWATDISPAALEVARLNARRLNVYNKIFFILADIWPQVNGQRYKFDLIISNPPYISRGQIDDLPQEVKFEPITALDGGDNGLNFYYKIINKSADYLKRGGYLILELGDNQSQEVLKIVASVNDLEKPQVFKDLNNRERVIVTKLK